MRDAGQQVDTIEVIAGNNPLDFIEERIGIERTQLGLKIVRRQPDSMTVGFAGLHAARLSHVRAHAFAEWDQSVHILSHGVGDADDQLQIGANAGAVCGFFDQLQIAVGIGDGAGFFVEARRGQYYVCQLRCRGQKHVLHDKECIVQCFRGNTQPAHWIVADNVEGGQLVARSRFEHLRKVETGLLGETLAIFSTDSGRS